MNVELLHIFKETDRLAALLSGSGPSVEKLMRQLDLITMEGAPGCGSRQ